MILCYFISMTKGSKGRTAVFFASTLLALILEIVIVFPDFIGGNWKEKRASEIMREI